MRTAAISRHEPCGGIARGGFRWTYHFDETVQILEGSVAITDAQGFTRAFKTGDVIFFPAGSVAQWRIETYIRKLAFCQIPMPPQLNIIWRAYRRPSRVAREIFRMALELPEARKSRRAQDAALSGSFASPDPV